MSAVKSVCVFCQDTTNTGDVFWHDDAAGKLHGRVHQACRDSFTNKNPYLQKKCPVCRVVIRQGLALESVRVLHLVLLGAGTQIVPIALRIALGMEVNQAAMAQEAILTGFVAATAAATALRAARTEIRRIALATTTGTVLAFGALAGISLGMSKY